MRPGPKATRNKLFLPFHEDILCCVVKQDVSEPNDRAAIMPKIEIIIAK